MSEQLTLTLDNISQLMSLLLMQITQYEIEGDHKEQREIEFGDYIGNSMYGFCL